MCAEIILCFHPLVVELYHLYAQRTPRVEGEENNEHSTREGVQSYMSQNWSLNNNFSIFPLQLLYMSFVPCFFNRGTKRGTHN